MKKKKNIFLRTVFTLQWHLDIFLDKSIKYFWGRCKYDRQIHSGEIIGKLRTETGQNEPAVFCSS